MIGVIAGRAEQDVVREFFELFKTPWEFYRRHRQYDVLICTGEAPFDGTAKLVIVYAGRRTQFDDAQRVATSFQRKRTCVLRCQGDRLPIYGDTVTFVDCETCLLTDEDSQQSVGYVQQFGAGARARIGYDLFGEIRRLLSEGQPPAYADLPALELHIALLRDLIIGCGVSLVEVPPVPDGHPFIACLTHDVDHPSMRQHQWDHTVLGFLHRAVVGSLRGFIRGRMSLRALVMNWAAALKVPLVYLGFAKDFWRDFADRYLELEQGAPSTFFVIPFKGCPGMSPEGPAPEFRAARYGAQDIGDIIQQLEAAGCEVGLHGIDAWLDGSRGREELEEIRRLSGRAEIGARIHWLYHDQQSPSALENAGAAYDSTVGYNGAVGYRAGTTQVYRPLTATRLLELPLHVMDTALFYPGHLGLSARQANTLVSRMVSNAVRFGGCLTVNWHDRSLAPERLWDSPYRGLVEDLKGQGAWFATAGQAVAWFRKRRSVVFETQGQDPDAARARVTSEQSNHLPGLRLRAYQARTSRDIGERDSGHYVDAPVEESCGSRVPCEVVR